MIDTAILPEHLHAIFFYLTIKELGLVARVCRIWNTASENKLVWQIQIEEIFGKNHQLKFNETLSFTENAKLFIKLARDVKGYRFNIHSIIPLEKFCALPELTLNGKRELGLDQYLPTSKSLLRGKGYINDKVHYFLIFRYFRVMNNGNNETTFEKGHFYYYQEVENSENYYWKNLPIVFSVDQIARLINSEKLKISEQESICLD